MSPAERRRWLRAAGLFVALLLVGAWPIDLARRGFSAAYAATANVLVTAVTFGRGGHARLAALDRPRERGPGEEVSADANLLLAVDGYEGELPVGVSLRRDAYLPLLIVLAAVVAAPLPWRRKGRALLVGLPAVFALTLVSLWLLVMWLFTHQLRGVYTAVPARDWLLDLIFRAFLLPPGHRFLVPFLLAAALVAWQKRVTAGATVGPLQLQRGVECSSAPEGPGDPARGK